MQSLDFNIDFTIKSNKAEVLAALHKAEERIFEMWGMKAQGYATMYAPVDTGNLRSSIGYKPFPNDKIMYVGTNVEYAPYQEFGTYKMKAHPFLKPALANHLPEYEDIVIGELAKEMNE